MSHEAIINTVLRFYPDVEAVYLFGSYGTADERQDSDVDIGLLFPPQKAKTVVNLATGECCQALSDVLKRSVDLINLRAVNIVFQHEIIQQGGVIYKQSENVVDEYEIIVMSLYQKLNDERANIMEDIYQTGRIIGS